MPPLWRTNIYLASCAASAENLQCCWLASVLPILFAVFYGFQAALNRWPWLQHQTAVRGQFQCQQGGQAILRGCIKLPRLRSVVNTQTCQRAARATSASRRIFVPQGPVSLPWEKTTRGRSLLHSRLLHSMLFNPI
jgi:hypothetical protein